LLTPADDFYTREAGAPGGGPARGGAGVGILVPMELSKLVISEVREEQVIVLKELEGDRSFPIVIGLHEAVAIDRGVRGIKAARPMTHDLVRNVIVGMDAALTSVVIHDIRNSTFYANLILRRNGTEVRIDSRPSDAIALALQMKAPIFVDEAVLKEVGAS
jgi:bifunctional DNase/RNase